MPVVSVLSKDPVRPAGGGSEFQSHEQARALDFQISVRPNQRPAGRSAGTILSRDKIVLCLI
jgi:hypothetical protein